jgi:ABC-2 type transport system permease protein
VQTVLFTTIYSGFALNTDITKGVFDRFRSLPIWNPSPIVGPMLADVIRYTISALIVIVIGLLMGFRPEAGLAGVLLALVLLNLFALGIGWIVLVLALTVRTPSTVMTASWLVLMPLTFGSNIYVDPATMPQWLQSFVAVNPVTHLVTALRGAIAGAPSLADITLAMTAPVLVTVLFGPLAIRLYRRKV